MVSSLPIMLGTLPKLTSGVVSHSALPNIMGNGQSLETMLSPTQFWVFVGPSHGNFSKKPKLLGE
jgi:hypothetical protein